MPFLAVKNVVKLGAANFKRLFIVWDCEVYQAQAPRTPPSNPPRPPRLQGSIWHRNRPNRGIDVPEDGEGEADSRVGSGGSVLNKPLTSLGESTDNSPPEKRHLKSSLSKAPHFITKSF